MSSSEAHRMKCEVLVFHGPSICSVSRDDLVNSLDIALGLNYWVGTIDHEGLRAEPWDNSCALLVFPHCTNTQSYDELNADLPTIKRIRQYVENGGSFLGICGGAYFASRTSEWNGNEWGSPNLAFWPWSSGGPHLDGPQTHEFVLSFLTGDNGRSPICDLHTDGGGEFVGESSRETASHTVMGKYSSGGIAGVKCRVGTGTAVLWHARLERSFRNAGVEQGFQRTHNFSRQYDVEKLERYRFRLLAHTLRHLSLQTALENAPRAPLSPLPQFLVSTTSHPQLPQNPFALLQVPGEILGEHDDFKLELLSRVTASEWETIRRRTAHQREPRTKQRRLWIICPEGLPNELSHTPLFNLASYFEWLGEARGRQLPNNLLGNNVLYGEAVTSTQTQLTSNPSTARRLPCPLLVLATFQLDGVGRYRRPWLSPYGVLQWSLLLELPSNLEHLTQNLDPFTHLLGLTVVETCRGYANKVALKWPNDIYANVNGQQEKIGGIVVNHIPATHPGSSSRILIGCGLNVCNDKPLCSLSQVAAKELPTEKVLADIMAQFSVCWDEFLLAGGSFAGFEERYQRAWLHRGWHGQIRLRPDETKSCTLLGLDALGRLRVQYKEQEGQPHTMDVTISVDQFSLDIRRSLIYPKVR